MYFQKLPCGDWSTTVLGSSVLHSWCHLWLALETDFLILELRNDCYALSHSFSLHFILYCNILKFSWWMSIIYSENLFSYIDTFWDGVKLALEFLHIHCAATILDLYYLHFYFHCVFRCDSFRLEIATSTLYTYLVLYWYMSLYLYLGMDPIEKEKLVPEFLHTQCSCLGSLTPPACPVLKACQGTVVKYQHLAGRTAHFTYFHWCF